MKLATNTATKMLGAVVVVFLIAVLAPEIFGELATLEGDTATPGWVYTLLVVIVGIGLVFMIWRLFK